MTPESIVTSLEWAIKLRNAGWPQEESHFTWVDSEGDISLHCGDFEWTPRIKATWFQFAAPTVGEFIKQIPVEQRRAMSYELMHDPDEWAELWISLNSK